VSGKSYESRRRNNDAAIENLSFFKKLSITITCLVKERGKTF